MISMLTTVFPIECSSQPCDILVWPTEPCETGTIQSYRCSFASHSPIVLPGTRARCELQGPQRSGLSIRDVPTRFSAWPILVKADSTMGPCNNGTAPVRPWPSASVRSLDRTNFTLFPGKPGAFCTNPHTLFWFAEPATYKLTQWGQPGQYVDVPKPSPGAGDVVIRMKAAGLCRSDLDMVDSKPGSAPYANSLEPGYILGHENAGFVDELGSAVTDLRVGEAVVVHHMRHCGNCEYCTDGAEQHCEAFKRNAIGMTRGCGIDGGLAEYLLVPRAEVISIGDGDPVLYAPLTDAGVTAYHAIQTAVQRLKPGTSAALIGIGGLGTYGVQFIKLLSSARIFAVDNIAERLQTAKEVGADSTVLFSGDGSSAASQILEQTQGRGVDAIIDFVGTPGTLKLAAKISRPRGRIVLVGMQGGTLEVGWGLLATSCEFAISLGSTRQDLREVCELARSGKLRIDVEEFKFDELDRAYQALRAGTLKGRAVVVFP